MKRTILSAISILTLILTLHFINNARVEHNVQVCFHNCPGVEPPDTRAIVTDADNKVFGECTMTNRKCCNIGAVPDGIYHIHFSQDSVSYCDTHNFTVNGEDKIVYIPCRCR